MQIPERTAAVVVVAGGIGSRMQDAAGRNKVYLSVGGRQLLSYSLETLNRCDAVGLVVLVVRDDDRDHAGHLAQATLTERPWKLAVGGATRHDSERSGVEATRPEVERGTIGVVAVHDGARPFMPGSLLDRVLDQAHTSGGAIAALPVADSLYRLVDGTRLEAEDHAWCQTPQAFVGATLLAAHDAAAAAGFQGADTAEVVQTFTEQRTTLVRGEPTNIKVTFADDLGRSEAIAGAWAADLVSSDGADQAAQSDRHTAAAVDAVRASEFEPSMAEPGHRSQDDLAVFVVEESEDSPNLRLRADRLSAALDALDGEVTKVAFVVDGRRQVDQVVQVDEMSQLLDSYGSGDHAGRDHGSRDHLEAAIGHRPATDAIKRVDGGLIESTVERSTIRVGVAPAVVVRRSLRAALDRVDGSAVVDPAALVAGPGGRVLLGPEVLQTG